MVFRIIMNDAGTITITSSFTSRVRLDDGGDDGACRGCRIRHFVTHNGLDLGEAFRFIRVVFYIHYCEDVKM